MAAITSSSKQGNVLGQVWTGISMYLFIPELVRLKQISKSWKEEITRCFSLNYIRINQPSIDFLARIEMHGDSESRHKAETARAIVTSFLQTHGMTKPKPRTPLAEITNVSIPTVQEVRTLNKNIAAVWQIATEAEARNALGYFSQKQATAGDLVRLEGLLRMTKQWYPSVVSVSQISQIVDKNTEAVDSIVQAGCLEEESLDWIGEDSSAASENS